MADIINCQKALRKHQQAVHSYNMKDIFGPVYISDDVSHKFNLVPPKVEVPKDVTGPVYLTEEARHKYSEFVKQVEGLKTIAGPVYLNEKQ